MNEIDKNNFQQDVALFIASLGKEISELRRCEALAIAEGRSISSDSIVSHRDSILTYLTEVPFSMLSCY